ncbi:hypothetical protein SLA2020_043230 [Shorea laevis]
MNTPSINRGRSRNLQRKLCPNLGHVSLVATVIYDLEDMAGEEHNRFGKFMSAEFRRKKIYSPPEKNPIRKSRGRANRDEEGVIESSGKSGIM